MIVASYRQAGVGSAVWAWFLGMLLFPPVAALAVTPDTPRVRQAVKKALAYLENNNDNRLGGKSLIGLTFAKHGEPDSHPKIASAIKAIQSALGKGPERFRAGIYDTGVAIMFLVAVDPSTYRYEIESLVRSLHLRQKSDGAWGYPLTHEKHGRTCDTSMTQYAVLGLWEAEDQAGVETPRLVWEQVARWLLLTQDPSGGFGYQGQPASRLGRQEKQAGVRDSMSVAAVGSLYIVKDRVGITQLKKRANDDTPDAFVPYEEPEEKAARIRTRIDTKHFIRAIGSGNRWIERELEVEKVTGYAHYTFYALERYESLREADLAGRIQYVEKSGKSKWYNRGAQHLLRTQEEDGHWESQSGAVPDTCFSALFLMGSTRKTLAAASVARYHDGTLIGGRGLPNDAGVRLRDGQVVVKPLDAPLDSVLRVTANPDDPKFARAVESLADAAKNKSAAELAPHGPILIRRALSGDRQVRMFAIRCLCRTKNLQYVPWLIHLLNDRDPDVAFEAAAALSEMSRKFNTLGFVRHPSEPVRAAAIEKWKSWYRTIKPDVDMDTFQPDLIPSAGYP